MRILPFAISLLIEVASFASAENPRTENSQRHIKDGEGPALIVRKRSQVNHKSHQDNGRRQAIYEDATEEEFDPYLGLPQHRQRDLKGNKKDGEPKQLDVSSDTAACSFCPDGMPNPDFVIPTDDAATCATAQAFAGTLQADADMCATVQLAQGLCCPPSPIGEIGIGPVIIEPGPVLPEVEPTTLPEIEELESMSYSMSMSMSMSMPATIMPCSFCPDGLTVDPEFTLPTNDGSTCATAMGFAATLPADAAMCATVQLAQGVCCPPSQPTTTEATTITTAEATTTTTTTTTTTEEATPGPTPAPTVEEIKVPEIPETTGATPPSSGMLSKAGKGSKSAKSVSTKSSKSMLGKSSKVQTKTVKEPMAKGVKEPSAEKDSKVSKLTESESHEKVDAKAEKMKQPSSKASKFAKKEGSSKKSGSKSAKVVSKSAKVASPKAGGASEDDNTLFTRYLRNVN